MTNYKIAMLIGIITIITATPLAFAEENYDVEIKTLDHMAISNHESIMIESSVLIPVDDFVTVKLVNPDGNTAHMVWYKVKANELTSFSHTFTDIEKLNIRDWYTIQLEYNNMIDTKTVLLN